MKLSLITKDSFFSTLSSEAKPWQQNYLAMYSTQWKGYATDPTLMMIPVDDHLVHRGDGVFDVMRCVHGRIYQMEAHLARLEKSAKAVSLTPPAEYRAIREILKELVRVGGEEDCIIRLLLSRGPGGFTTNPFECPASQLYINVIRHPTYPREYYTEGIPVITSNIPAKKPFFATTKSCNYLQNVLMKMEAVQAGCPYSIGLDEQGNLTEGSTENVGVVTKDGILKFPGFENTLAGITAQRVFELARKLVEDKVLRGARFERVPLEEAYRCSEIFLTGTSINLLPVVKVDGRTIGTGRPGPIYARLLSLIEKDLRENKSLLTEVDWDLP